MSALSLRASSASEAINPKPPPQRELYGSLVGWEEYNLGVYNAYDVTLLLKKVRVMYPRMLEHASSGVFNVP